MRFLQVALLLLTFSTVALAQDEFEGEGALEIAAEAGEFAEDEAAAGDTGVVVAEEGAAEVARRGPRVPQAPRQEVKSRSYTREWLAIIGLLLLWLLTRSDHVAEARARARPERHDPVTPGELGRIVFSVARSGDLSAYRALFISGAEAGEAMGVEAAQKYLMQRTHQVLERAFKRLSGQLTGEVQYHSGSLDGETFSIHVVLEGGHNREVIVGDVVTVGAVYRIVLPG